jgi:hypothetical protein
MSGTEGHAIAQALVLGPRPSVGGAHRRVDTLADRTGTGARVIVALIGLPAHWWPRRFVPNLPEPPPWAARTVRIEVPA